MSFKYSWVIFAALGTIIGVIALATQPITPLIKWLLFVTGGLIVVCILLAPYFGMKKIAENMQKTIDSADAERVKTRQLIEKLQAELKRRGWDGKTGLS